jgi:hypothetical protein
MVQGEASMNENSSVDRASFEAQVAAILNDQWKWRHQHCWKLLNRYGLTGLTIAIVPYLHRLDFFSQKLDELVGRLGNWELFFPLAGWAIAQSAVYLFTEEYVRCRPVETMCNKVLARQHSSPLPIPVVSTPAKTHKARLGQAIKRVPRSIGQTTILLYSSLATILTLANMYMIIIMYKLPIDITQFKRWGWSLSAVCILLAFLLSKRAGEKITDILTNQEQEESSYRGLVKKEADLAERLLQNAELQSISALHTSAVLPSSADHLADKVRVTGEGASTQHTKDGQK